MDKNNGNDVSFIQWHDQYDPGGMQNTPGMGTDLEELLIREELGRCSKMWTCGRDVYLFFRENVLHIVLTLF